MTHFPGCQPIEEHHSSGRVLQEPAQEDWDLTSEVVSKDKVRWAIDSFGTFEATGEDKIFPGLLQHGIGIIIGHIILLHVWRMVTLHTACMEGSKGYKSDIFLFENDGKVGGFLHKSGTIEILPAYEITVCIPERQIH
jgi:hypothetical protein